MTPTHRDRPWTPPGLAGFTLAGLGPDLLAGLTLAAIAIPEQIAIARLAGLPPAAGLVAFVVGGTAFALAGASPFLSCGADSTIAPIFAGSVTALASGGVSPSAVAAILALMVGGIVAGAGLARMSWIGDLVSAPALTGFLAGVAGRIALSQAPAVLGHDHARAWPLALALGVVAVIALAEKLNRRIPAAILAVGLAAALAQALHLDPQAAPRLGALAPVAVAAGLPAAPAQTWLALAPLALVVAAVVMVQTASVSRAFAPEGRWPRVDRDLIGVGLGSVLSGLSGAFAVDASPPRTAIAQASGARSQVAGLAAAAFVALLAFLGLGLLRAVPTAALAGVLLTVAARLVRLGEMRRLLTRSPAEFGLMAATAAAILLLPIAWGVAAGVGLSILHGVWSGARVQVRPMGRLPGTTVWWPDGEGPRGERAPGVQVLAFPAPLTFLVADAFAREFLQQLDLDSRTTRLAVLEAAGMALIDYTAAGALTRVITACRAAGCDFALARLESPAAQTALGRLGLLELIGADHVVPTVEEAVRRFGPRR